MTPIYRLTRHRWGSDIFDDFRERPDFRQAFEVSHAGVLDIALHCEIKHRGLVNGVIGVGARVKFRFAPTHAGLETAPLQDIEGAVAGGNILNGTHHYLSIAIGTAMPLVPGWYRIEVHMASYTTLAHKSGECASINNQTSPAGKFGCYNMLKTVEWPGAILHDLTPAAP